jgi:hypothetical protein
MNQKAKHDLIDRAITKLSLDVRCSTLDIAAKVAKLYGASDEVVEHILMLKTVGKQDAR